MKQKQSVLSVLYSVSILLCIYSCKKSTTSPNPSTTTSTTSSTSTGPSSFSCIINGTPFKADSSRVAFYSGGVGIVGYKAGQVVIEVDVNKPYLGKHTLKPSSHDEMGIYYGEFITWICRSGELNITAIDSNARTAKGTFHFENTDDPDPDNQTRVTEGVFDIKR
jgi:hypothetical protein